MILYLEYGADSDVYETQKIHIDLVNSDISTVEFIPGIFPNPAQLIAQATAKVNIHGKPAFTHATMIIGRLQVQVQTNIGRNFGAQVYLWYSPTDDRQLYRARVYALDFQLANDSAYFLKPDRNLEAVITISHGVWQGTLTQLPLTNTHQTDYLNPLTIENSKDTLGRDNTITIKGEDVEGDVPAPVRLQIVNTTAGVDVVQYWIGMNVNSTPLQFVHVLEGEAATPLNNVVKADASNGAGNEITVTQWLTDQDVLTWSLDVVATTRAAGNQFHILIKTHYFEALSDKLYWRFTVLDGSGTHTLWKGEQVSFPYGGPNLSTGDYGVVRIPPWRVDRSLYTPAAIKLKMSCQLITSGVPVKQLIDAIYLFACDGFRNIKILDTLDQNDYLVDDMIDQQALSFPGAGGTYGSVACLGNPIMVHPGRNLKLYFLANHTGGDSAETTSTVQIWYRPQRLIL